MIIIDLIVALVIGLFIFISRFVAFLLINKKYKNKNHVSSIEIQYLKNRFRFKSNLNKKYIYLLISISDALILSISLFASLLFSSNIYLELVIGMVFLIILILVLNEIIGRILILKGVK